jgi:hypothetical protein
MATGADLIGERREKYTLGVGFYRGTSISPNAYVRIGAFARRQTIGFSYNCTADDAFYTFRMQRYYGDVSLMFDRYLIRNERFALSAMAGANLSFTAHLESFYTFYQDMGSCDVVEVARVPLTMTLQGGLTAELKVADGGSVVLNPFVDWSLPDLSPYRTDAFAPANFVLYAGLRVGYRWYDEEDRDVSGERRKTALYAEALGRTYRGMTINGEVQMVKVGPVSLNANAGFGLSEKGSNGGKFLYTPLGLSMLVGRGRHQAEVAPSFVLAWDQLPVGWPTIQAGYRFNANNGFYCRANVAYMNISIVNARFLHPGLSLGYRL